MGTTHTCFFAHALHRATPRIPGVTSCCRGRVTPNPPPPATTAVARQRSRLDAATAAAAADAVAGHLIRRHLRARASSLFLWPPTKKERSLLQWGERVVGPFMKVGKLRVRKYWLGEEHPGWYFVVLVSVFIRVCYDCEFSWAQCHSVRTDVRRGEGR